MRYLQSRRDSSELDNGHKLFPNMFTATYACPVKILIDVNTHTHTHAALYCTHPQPARPKTAPKPDNECEMVKSLIL